MDIQKVLLIINPLSLYHRSFMHSSLSCHLLRSTRCQALEDLEIEKQKAGWLLPSRKGLLITGTIQTYDSNKLLNMLELEGAEGGLKTQRKST